MHVLVIYKFKNGRINSDQGKVEIFWRLRAANSVFSGGIWLKFEHIIVCIDALVTCKNEEDPIKNEGARVNTTFLTL